MEWIKREKRIKRRVTYNLANGGMVLAKYPKYHYRVILLDLNNDLSDGDLDDIVEKIGVYSEAEDLDVSVMKKEHITEDQDEMLKEKIKPNKYPYYLITRGENEKLNRIKKAYKKQHWVKNLLGWIDPIELGFSTLDYMLDFERTVFHTDNTDDVINYLVEHLEVTD